jgi:hypothetical protein
LRNSARSGSLSEALDQFREALTAFRVMGDGWQEGVILGDLGVVYEYLGRDKEALEHQEKVWPQGTGGLMAAGSR